MRIRRRAVGVAVLAGLSLAGNVSVQETRKVLSNPTPVYPEIARQFRLTGVVKVQLVVGADGKVKDVKIVGGHPLFVSAVQEAVKNWKYAPGSGESTVLVEFSFHP